MLYEHRSVAVRQNYGNIVKFVLTLIIGSATIVGIQILQFGIIYPMVYDFGSKKSVDTSSCNCECWDTWFKGYYEYFPGRYHHVYFNTTYQTACIWAVTVLYVIGIYECIRHIISSIWQGSYRAIYCLLFAVGIYSHQYTWWSYFGYFNDDFYDQMFHQTLFSLTEFYASWMVLMLATTNSPLNFKENCISIRDLDTELSRLSMLAAISLAHLAVGSLDQFIEQNVFGNGHFSQQSRNAGFILPDALGVLFPIRDLFVLMPYLLEMEGSKFGHRSNLANKDYPRSLLGSSINFVSKVFFSQHFHRALLIFFVVVFFGTVL